MYALKLGCSAVLCLGLLSACSLSKTTPVDKDTENSSEAALYRSCTQDKDCVIACRTEKVCCGELCECSDVINRTRDKELREWELANCELAECKVADCDVPEFDHHPKCVNALCVDQKTPWIPPHAREP